MTVEIRNKEINWMLSPEPYPTDLLKFKSIPKEFFLKSHILPENPGSFESFGFRSIIHRFFNFFQITILLKPPLGGLGVSYYSYLSDSTGFLVAVRKLCQLTVRSAIMIASKPARAKIHHLSSVL